MFSFTASFRNCPEIVCSEGASFSCCQPPHLIDTPVTVSSDGVSVQADTNASVPQVAGLLLLWELRMDLDSGPGSSVWYGGKKKPNTTWLLNPFCFLVYWRNLINVNHVDVHQRGLLAVLPHAAPWCRSQSLTSLPAGVWRSDRIKTGNSSILTEFLLYCLRSRTHFSPFNTSV